jgi:hypothetical protein
MIKSRPQTVLVQRAFPHVHVSSSTEITTGFSFVGIQRCREVAIGRSHEDPHCFSNEVLKRDLENECISAIRVASIGNDRNDLRKFFNRTEAYDARLLLAETAPAAPIARETSFGHAHSKFAGNVRATRFAAGV